MFGTIPAVILADVSTIVPVVPEVAAAIVASPTRVLDLDVHFTSETDPFEDLSSLFHAPAAPIVSPFLHSSDSFKASHDSSGSDLFESLLSLDSYEIVVARWRGKVASRSISSSSTHILSSTDIASPTLHEIIPAPPGRHRAPSYSSSSDSPAFTTDDSPTPHRFVDPHPVRTLRDSEAYRRWRAAPLSTVYPPTTSESTSGHFLSDLSTSSSKRPPHPSATYSPTPSPFAGPSRKSCRSPTTLIPLDTPTPGALSPTRADLLLLRKRIRGFLAASSPEDSKVAATEAATTDEVRAEIEIGLERDDEAKDEAESCARGTVEIGVNRVIEPEIHADSLIPAQRIADIEEEQRAREIQALADEKEMTRMRERISVLEGSNMRLRGALAEERERAGSVWHRLGYIQDELRHIRSSRYYDRMDFRKLETFAMRRLGYRP
ncbi:hypothetical protein Tco_0533706 [Tanacetum coccineum]